MSLPALPGLTSVPALDRPDLLADPVATGLRAWSEAGVDVAGRVAVVEIEPDLADTAAMSEAYGVDLEASANCVVVAGKRAGEERVAACVVRADTRADVNHRVKGLLDVRKLSFMGTDAAVERSGMVYGGITPVGLPTDWRLLLDARVPEIDVAVVGSGVRHSKLLLPGSLLAELPGAEVVDGLAG